MDDDEVKLREIKGCPCTWIEVDGRELTAGDGDIAPYPDGIAYHPTMRAFRVRPANKTEPDYYLPESMVSAWSYGYRGMTPLGVVAADRESK